MEKKEIHFWKDTIGIGSIMYDLALKTHNATMSAIRIGEEMIHTYAISALDFSYLLDCGYNIYLHENGKSFQIKEGNVIATDKEIRKAHNIGKIWLGGGFDTYFYGNESYE